MTFKPGESGNPGGRPKDIKRVKDLAREYTDEAIETLALVMKSGESERGRVSAAVALLDRGWGKPTQPIAGDGDEAAVRFEEIRRTIVEPSGHTDGGSVPPAAPAG